MPVFLKPLITLTNDSPWKAPTLMTRIKLAKLNLELRGRVSSDERS